MTHPYTGRPASDGICDIQSGLRGGRPGERQAPQRGQHQRAALEDPEVHDVARVKVACLRAGCASAREQREQLDVCRRSGDVHAGWRRAWRAGGCSPKPAGLGRPGAARERTRRWLCGQRHRECPRGPAASARRRLAMQLQRWRRGDERACLGQALLRCAAARVASTVHRVYGCAPPSGGYAVSRTEDRVAARSSAFWARAWAVRMGAGCLRFLGVGRPAACR